MIDIRRTIIWVILLGAGGFLIGCDEGPPVPISPETSWDLLRYHEYDDSGFLDLLITGAGDVSIQDRRGGGDKSREGFLSAGTLADLDDLVNAVEPLESRAEEPCHEGPRFFVSIRRGQDLQSFGGSECDPVMEVQEALAAALRQLGAEDLNLRSVLFSRIAGGRGRLQPGTYVVRGRDALTRLVDELSPDQPVVWPAVDFRQEMIFGVAGDSGLEAIEIQELEISEGGVVQARIMEFTAVDPCPRRPGWPFEFIRLPLVGGDILIERVIVEFPCTAGD